MKRIIFLLLLLPSLCWGQEYARMNPYILGSGAAAAVYTCHSGTYMFYYDGEYSGDTDKACSGSGAGTLDGNAEGGSFSTSGGTATGCDNDVYWENTAGTTFPTMVGTDSAGSIYFTFTHNDDGDEDVETTALLEFRAYANNAYIRINIQGASNTVTAVQYDGSNTAQVTSTDTVSSGGTYRVGYTWDTANNTHAIGIKTPAAAFGDEWEDEDNDTINPWPTNREPQMMIIGEVSSSQCTSGEGATVTDFAVVSGYKATDPY